MLYASTALEKKSWRKKFLKKKKSSGAKLFAVLKGRKKSKKNPKSFGGKIFALLNGAENKESTKSFGGKIVLRKKTSVLLSDVMVLIQKYTKSFGGKNLALCKRFVSSKVKVYV